jgi:arabinofuranosyltransferase
VYASSQTDRRGVAWSVVGAAIPFLLLAGLYWEFVVDDAYITFRYAIHFANGVGLVYNPTTIVDGYTSFLWTVLLGCAVCAFAEANIVLITKILATALSVLALSYVCFLARSAPLHQPLWIAAVLTAASPAFVISAADGLETPLYIAVQMVFVARWLRDLQDSLLSTPLGMWAALLALVRPDGLLLVVLSVLLFLWLSSRESKSLARLLPFAVAFSVIYLPYFTWHWLYYGYPFPNTFYAKMGGQWDLFVQGVDRLLKWQQEMGSIVSLLFVLFALFKLRLPYTYILAAVVLARALLVLWSGGEVMGHHRFMAPAVPAYWLLFQAGLWGWLGRVSSSHRLTRYAKLVIPLILLCASGAITVSHLPKYQQYAEGLSQAHIRLGRWIHQNTSPETRIAVGDAGAIPYYARRHTIDIMGLNDPHIAHLPGRLGRRIDTDYILSQKPDLIILLSEVAPPADFKGLTPIDQALYEAVIRRQEYILHSVYQFNERYYLWVMARQWGRWMQRPCD